MAWFNFWRRNHQPQRPLRRTRLHVEALEDRMVPASVDLIAYRPVTEHINYANYKVAEAQEESHTEGAGIRFNGDDDDGNKLADHLDSSTATAGDNDLVRVDASFSGTSTELTYSNNLTVWASNTKSQKISSGSAFSGQFLWVEFIGSAHTTGTNSAVLKLTAVDGNGSASDSVVFHSFQSVVVAIGGYNQNPANVGSSGLGVFTIGLNLYQKGYDVKLFSETQVSTKDNGSGAAFNEAYSAVTLRKVGYVAIYGFSWGGGATYELAAGLKANTTLNGQFTLSYTAAIDGITHGGLSSERRLPPGTNYHDNIYQRKDWLLKGNSVTGAVNLNVTTGTTWGKNLVHTAIDDNADVHSIIITNLTAKVVR